MNKKHFFITLSLMFFSANLYSQRVITGKISDLHTKTAVEKVDVSIYKGTDLTSTNKLGYFQLTVQDGDSLLISHPDYKLGIVAVPEPDVFSLFIEKVKSYPTYLDGYPNLYQYLQRNLKYPPAARKADIEGILVIQLSVDSAGSIRECTVLNDMGCKCSEQVIKVFTKIPGKWSEHNEEQKFIFPIIFSIGETKKDLDVPNIKLVDGKIMEPIFVTANAHW